MIETSRQRAREPLRRLRVALRSCLVVGGVLATGVAWGADEYSFDASEYEQKTLELGGWTQFKQESLKLNPAAAGYRLGYLGQPQRRSIDRSTVTLELVGKLRQGIGTFDLHTHSDVSTGSLDSDHNHLIYEAAYSLRPDPGVTIEAGKRTLRWGKGYAWNPIGFVERSKDPNDPELAREGVGMAYADLIMNREGALKTVALTPVLMPVTGTVNSDLGAHGHLNPAAKLYMLYRDVDIDIAWQGKGSRSARVGADMSANVTSNFEVHGEWARYAKLTKPVLSSTGNVSTETGAAASWLLGVRYLTESDTTWIAEYYRNGAGYSSAAVRQYDQFVASAFEQFLQTGSDVLLRKASSVFQSAYGRPNAGSNYLYLRVQQRDALGIVYFQPALTSMVNLSDRSFQVTPELLYTGVKNTDFRLRLYLLSGNSGSDFGEKSNSRKIEAYARVYF